ncbi:MAG: Ig-like domain-containing protein, partial [Candidatus Gracilibacteria bacterium]|nr:Ig-like domain-containing protein [Candidatus Gracilibacteria bacterium]
LANSTTLKIGKNILNLKYTSNTPITRIDVYAGTTKLASTKIDKLKSGTEKISLDINETTVGSSSLKIIVVDENYYSASKEIILDSLSTEITNNENDTSTNTTTETQTSSSLPDIIIKNPASGNIKIYEDQSFNLRFESSDETGISGINIYLDGKTINSNLDGKTNVVAINANNDIPVGNHTITIEATNNNFKKNTKDINIEIMAR